MKKKYRIILIVSIVILLGIAFAYRYYVAIYNNPFHNHEDLFNWAKDEEYAREQRK
jgi:uncharacterized protein YpmB